MAEWVIASNMGATLSPIGPGCFSETARSHPLHHEAAGDRRRARRGAAVLGGRLANDRPKGPAERAQAAEADVERDLGHARVGLAQQRHGPLDAPPLQVAVRGLAERRAEGADEVGL